MSAVQAREQSIHSAEDFAVGMDIWASSGLIIYIDDMVGLVNDTNFSVLRRIMIERFTEVKKAAEDQHCRDWQDRLEYYTGKISGITEESDRSAVVEACFSLDEYLEQRGELFIWYNDWLQEMWSGFIDEQYPDLPCLGSIEVFKGNSRIEGDEVPKEVICYIFDDSACYEEVLTDVGKKFENIFGSIEKTSWTVLSI